MPPLEGDYGATYEKQKSLGQPIYYQTATNLKLQGNWQQTLQWAVEQGATTVKLPDKYGTYDKAKLAAYNTVFIANQSK